MSDVSTIHEEKPVVKTEPVVVVQPLPASVTYMGGPVPIPPRQVWAGGISFVLAWLVLYFLKFWGGPDFEAIGVAAGFPPGSAQTFLAGIIGSAVAWAVPPTWSDIIKRLNDRIVHAAMRDQQSNVSNEQVRVATPSGSEGMATDSPLNNLKAAAAANMPSRPSP